MAYQKLTPIVATGATEPRYLGDRFADMLTVKDFGAKGDGTADDTVAFTSAAATGKTVFVPAGTYKITSPVHGDFTGIKGVSFTDYKLYAKKIGGNKNVAYMKRPVVGIRLIWNELLEYSETRFIPQAIAVFDDHVFLRMTPNESNPVDGRGWIGVFDIATGDKVSIFSTGATTLDQGLRVFRDASDNKRKLVCKYYDSNQTSDGLAVYDITTIPEDGSEIEPVSVHSNLNLGLDWFYGGGFYYICQNTRQDGVVLDRTVFAKYNENFERVGFMFIPQTDGARIQNPYTYDPDGNDAVDIKDACTKAQGWTIRDGIVYMSGGGSSVLTNYCSCNGIRAYNASGEKIMSALSFPDKYVEKLESITGDTTIDCENEGITVDEYGRMYSLVSTVSNSDMSSTDRNFWVIEEMSEAVDAVDFSDTAAMDLAVNIDKLSIGIYPITGTSSGKMMNPWTGGVFSSIDEVLDYMVFAGQKTLAIYKTNFIIKDLNNKDFPDAAIVKLLLLNAITVYCEIYRSSDTYSYVNNTEFLYRKEDGVWGKLQVAKRSLSNLVLNKDPYGTGDPGGTIYSVSNDRTSLVSCLDFTAGTSNKLLYVGGQNAAASPDRVYLGVNNGGSYSSVMFLQTTFRPGQTGINLGTGSFPWDNFYANSGPWSSSDERKKDNIEDVSESAMRAWGKVRFKFFQFKDAIKKKGKDARLHVGVVAQQVAAAFASEGLDANRFGLFGYDKWEDQFDDVVVVDQEEKLDNYGNVVQERMEHTEKRLVLNAGDSYSIRYEEALALECAYQRWRLEQLEERVNQLTNNSNK